MAAKQKVRAPLESAIKRTIMRYLGEKHPSAVVRKRHGTNFATAGDPDLYFLLRGVHYEIEIKQPGKSPTPLQLARLEAWRAAGATVMVVHSLQEFTSFLSELGVIPYTPPKNLQLPAAKSST